MRLCLLDDLLAGARALSLCAPAARPQLANRLLYEAHSAHCYAKRFRAPHPRWGNGSLMARALADLPGGGAASPCYASIAVMAAAIARFRARVD